MRLHRHFTRVAGIAVVLVALAAGLGMGPGAAVARAADTTTTVSTSDANAVWGQPVTFTAMVTATTTPQGSVQFQDSTAALGAPVPLSGGSASIEENSLAVGQHSISAHFIPTGDFSPSDSVDPAVVKVSAAGTTTTVTLSTTSAVAGQPVLVTATVTALPPSGKTPTGSVGFAVGSGPSFATQTLDSSGRTSIGIYGGAGTYSVRAMYSNTGGNFVPSDGMSTLQVGAADTTVRLTSSQNPVAPGGTLSFTAIVSVTPPGDWELGGSLQFTVDGRPLGAPIPLGGDNIGYRMTVTAPTAAGTNTIGVTYSGDENTKPSSASLQQVVGPGATANNGSSLPAPVSTRLSSTNSALVTALRLRGFAALTMTQTFTAPGPGVLEQKVYSPNAPKAAAASTRKVKNVLLASAKRTFTAAGNGTLRLKLTAAGRKAIRKGKSLKIAIVTRFTPKAGKPTAAIRYLTVKPKHAKPAGARATTASGWRLTDTQAVH